MLNGLIEKAMAKYAEAFTASLETVNADNKALKLELASVVAAKEEMKEEFKVTLSKVGTELEEIAKSEVSTASKPTEFKALTRAEKAAKMGAAIRAIK